MTLYKIIESNFNNFYICIFQRKVKKFKNNSFQHNDFWKQEGHLDVKSRVKCILKNNSCFTKLTKKIAPAMSSKNHVFYCIIYLTVPNC